LSSTRCSIERWPSRSHSPRAVRFISTRPSRRTDRRRQRKPGDRVAGAHRARGQSRGCRCHRPADSAAQSRRRNNDSGARSRSRPIPLRSRPLSNRSGLIISACDGDQPTEFVASLSDLRQTADTTKPAFLLGTLRSDRPRPLAQRQLPYPDRRRAGRKRR
jgi:hypothetical protein